MSAWLAAMAIPQFASWAVSSEGLVCAEMLFRRNISDGFGNKCTLLGDYLHSFHDEPAVVTANGIAQWYHFGLLHRETGPANIYPCGCRIVHNGRYYHVNAAPAEGLLVTVYNYEWYDVGLLHRTDGPAIEYANGDEEFHVNGRFMRATRAPAGSTHDHVKLM